MHAFFSLGYVLLNMPIKLLIYDDELMMVMMMMMLMIEQQQTSPLTDYLK